MTAPLNTRIAVDRQFCLRLFDELLAFSRDEPGVTRAAYGEGEARAHDLVRREAAALGLRVDTDVAGNLYLTWPGEDPALPGWLVGSHLDTVPHGGNFDGAAGVIGSLAAIDAIRRAGLAPRRSITVVAFRAEESTWFPASYVGSRAALGLLEPAALDLKRSDTGRSLRQHLSDAGFDPDAVARGAAHLSVDRIYGFVEMHIEQGPSLETAALPLGLVTGISGSFRYRQARCMGVYAHSGAVDRADRSDAVFALADLIHGLDKVWAQIEREGGRVTVTVGEVATDPLLHAFAKVPGEVRFCLDIRSADACLLRRIEDELVELIGEIETARSVRFLLSERTVSSAAAMSQELIERLASHATKLDIPHRRMVSGAGHDTAVLANAGVPSAMIFIRNQNGSHNPDEGMQIEDLCTATEVIAGLLID